LTLLAGLSLPAAGAAGRTLRVGEGEAFSRLAAAVAAARDGDTILIRAGTYQDDFAEIHHRLTIRGVGGMARLLATQPIPNGKAILVTRGDVTVEHLELAGARVPSGNGAGIRYEGGRLVVSHCYFHDNQDGILGGIDPSGSISVTASEFADNGTGDGFTHAVYVGHIREFRITDSYLHDTRIGHHIKSRADETVIRHNRIFDQAGTASYGIDLPNGGVGLISRNVIAKSAASDNKALIHFGGESPTYPATRLRIEENDLISRHPQGVGLRNQTAEVAVLAENLLFGLRQLHSGPAREEDNTPLAAAPLLDTGRPWAAAIH
jgi:hypothetical protein